VNRSQDPPRLPPNAISAAVVVRNEEAVIERCLRSVDGVVDEIVLVHDGPCEDRTLEIAERYGCRIFVRPATGNPEHHTVFAYDQARGDWLLSVDADEFLSDELRAGLRALTRRDGVNGYAFLWRMWDGRRYVTERGPFKLALFRRSATRLVGLLSACETVDGVTERSSLQLEHRPLYNNFELRSVVTKWRRWTKVQARQYLSDFSEIPKFNYAGPDEWPLRRRVANRLAPILFLPYGVAVFLAALYRERAYYSLRENLRFAMYQGLYAGMVQLYVARFVYLR
jgi:glycosyltransferase involved in cell wall biosynthesis